MNNPPTPDGVLPFVAPLNGGGDVASVSALPRPLRGILTPMVTPLLDPDSLDRAAVRSMVERLITAGVSGLFVLGTTGEAPGLSYRLRSEMVELTCSAANGRVPVLVSITDTAMSESLRFARKAADAGAAAVVLAPPYYFPMSQGELLAYVRRVARELTLPLYLYNIPSLTRTEFASETVRSLADLPNIYGIKDSSGNMPYFAALVKALGHRPDFAILCGPEEKLVETMRMGGHGAIAGGSNIWPELYVNLYHSELAGDRAAVSELLEIVLDIGKHVYSAGPDYSSYLRGMKGALSVLGYCRNVLAEPFLPFGEAETAAIRAALKLFGLQPVEMES